jgi:hypothetical protein
VAYRRSLRRLGPLVALLPPLALLTAAGVIWLVWPCDGLECVTPSLLVYGLAGLALPTALPSGFPLVATPFTAIVMLATSALLWMFLGRWAARRATASPVATWREWWVELANLIVGVWAGVLGGLLITGFVLSR